MTNPYFVTECGHTFEKRDIEDWINKKGCCPLCKTKTEIGSLRPNYQLKEVISHYQSTNKGDKQEK